MVPSCDSSLHRCSSAETQIVTLLNTSDIGSADFNPVVLAEYYLLGQGGSLNAIAKTATGVDFNAVMSTVADTVQKAITVSVERPLNCVLCLLKAH